MRRDHGREPSTARRAARRAIVTSGLALVVVAVCVASGAAVSTKPGSSCAHPLKSGGSLEGKLTGATKYIQTIVQNGGIKEGGSWSTTKGGYQIKAEATTSRVVICKAEILSVPILIKIYGPVPPGTPVTHHQVKLVLTKANYSYALSSKVILPATSEAITQAGDEVYFRLKPTASRATAATAAKPGSSCAHPLKAGQHVGGPLWGDQKDLYSSTIPDGNTTTSGGQHYIIQAFTRNPKLVICRSEILSAPSRSGPVTRHKVTVTLYPGPHGKQGASTKILLPASPQPFVGDEMFFYIK